LPAPPHLSLNQENSWAHIWHSFLIFAAFRPSGSGRPAGVLASWLVTGALPLAAGWMVGQRRLRRRCGHHSPTSAGCGPRTDLTWAEWVAGPGFEPGKTVVGDFTDPGRYHPDQHEHRTQPRLRHALDMVARCVPCWAGRPTGLVRASASSVSRSAWSKRPCADAASAR